VMSLTRMRLLRSMETCGIQNIKASYTIFELFCLKHAYSLKKMLVSTFS
jgi:hypothetical protein